MVVVVWSMAGVLRQLFEYYYSKSRWYIYIIYPTWYIINHVQPVYTYTCTPQKFIGNISVGPLEISKLACIFGTSIHIQETVAISEVLYVTG